eukprot:gene5531-biopygen10913
MPQEAREADETGDGDCQVRAFFCVRRNCHALIKPPLHEPEHHASVFRMGVDAQRRPILVRDAGFAQLLQHIAFQLCGELHRLRARVGGAVARLRALPPLRQQLRHRRQAARPDGVPLTAGGDERPPAAGHGLVVVAVDDDVESKIKLDSEYIAMIPW